MGICGRLQHGWKSGGWFGKDCSTGEHLGGLQYRNFGVRSDSMWGAFDTRSFYILTLNLHSQKSIFVSFLLKGIKMIVLTIFFTVKYSSELVIPVLPSLIFPFPLLPSPLHFTHRESFSKSYWINLKSDCIYHFPVNLDPNGRPFGSKSTGKW